MTTQMVTSTRAEVTFELRNIDTLEIEGTMKQCNTFTKGNIEKMMPTSERMAGVGNLDKLFLSEMPGVEDPLGGIPPSVTGANGYILWSQTSTVKSWEFNRTTVPYHEAIFRFAPHTSDRAISMAYLGISAHSLGTVIRVDPTCVQTTTQVLDVKYRIFLQDFYEDGVISDSEKEQARTRFARLGNNPAGPDLFCWMTHSMYDNAVTAFIPASHLNPSTSVGGSTLYIRSTAVGAADFKNIFFNDLQGVLHTTGKIDYEDMVGVPIKRIQASKSATSMFLYPSIIETENRVQTIHHHAETSTKPYEDIDHLSSSSAELVITDTSMVKGFPPKTYHIRHHGTGAIGSTSYEVWYRTFLGTTGNEFSYGTIPQPTGLGSPAYRRYTSKYQEPNDMHGSAMWLATGNKVEWSPYVWITFSQKGFDIFCPLSGESHRYDEDNKGLNVTEIISVNVNHENGDVWVACLQTGVWRVSNPMSSAGTVHSFTSASHGIQPGGCYGADVGYGEKVWAMFDGALCSTVNAGVSWEKHNETTGTFVHAGLTDLNWQNARQLSCNRTDPNQMMAIGLMHPYGGLADSNHMRILIYTGVGGQTAVTDDADLGARVRSDPTAGHWPDGSHPQVFDESVGTTVMSFMPYGIFKFTKRAGILYVSSTNAALSSTYNNVFKIIDTETGSTAFTGPGYGATTSILGILYDGNDVPYFCTSNSVFMVDRKVIAYTAAANGYLAISEAQDGKGPFSTSWGTRKCIPSESDHTVKSLRYVMGKNEDSLNMTSPTLTPTRGDSMFTSGFRKTDPYETKYSLTEDLTFGAKVWNGTAMVDRKDWMKPAINSYNSGQPGMRHNFRPNEYTFRGRQYLDITSSMPSLGDEMSFSFTMKKITNVDVDAFPEEVILGINMDRPDHRRLELYRTLAGDNTLALVNGATIQNFSSPIVDNIDVRVTLTLDGQIGKLYFDGVLQQQVDMGAGRGIDYSTVTHVFVGGKPMNPLVKTHKPLPNLMLCAEIKDVMVWSKAMTDADAAVDHATTPSVAVPSAMNSTDMRGHFKLTENLGELRPSHSTLEPFIDGMSMTMNNGSSGNSITDTDYHTVTTTEGILMENTNKMDLETHLYTYPTHRNYTTLNSNISNSTVPPTGNSVEKVLLPMHSMGSSSSAQDTTPGEGEWNGSWQGAVIKSGTNQVTAYGGYRFSGEFSVTFGNRTTNGELFVGFIEERGVYNSGNVGTTYGVSFSGGNVSTVINGDSMSVTAMVPVAFTQDDIFRLTRRPDDKLVLSSIHATTGVATTIDTSASAFPGNLFFYAGMPTGTPRGGGLWGITCSTSLDPNTSFFGHKANATGVYGERFMSISSVPTRTIVKINGVVMLPEFLEIHEPVTPAALPEGECRIYTALGLIEFSPLDVGKPLEIRTDVMHFHGG